MEFYQFSLKNASSDQVSSSWQLLYVKHLVLIWYGALHILGHDTRRFHVWASMDRYSL